MLLKSIQLTFLLLFAFSGINAQTVDMDYWDGQAYFKLNNDSDIVIEDMDDLLGNDDHREIREILTRYNVSEIKRTFLVLNTPVFDRTYEVRFSEIERVGEMIKELETLDYMEYAERVPIMRKSYVPNDPDQNTQYSLDLINAQDAWDLHQGGNAVIAVVDDAVMISHEDLAPNKYINPGEIGGNNIDDDNNGYIDDISGYDIGNSDADPNPPAGGAGFTHGTHCAGIASGATDNGVGMASIGFNCKILGVKCNPNSYTGNAIQNAYQGVVYALAGGADVLSLSWGGGGSSSTNQNIILQAHNLGVTIVAAAGNDNSSSLQYPAAYDYVIAVANTNQNDIRNGSSNYGEWVDISAPGTAIYSTLATSNVYGNQTGTSMACPMVAGLCGLIKSFNPLMSPGQIEACIKSTAVNINGVNSGFANLLGAGRIDAFAALQCASPNAAPIVQVSSNATQICPGESVKFEDVSFYTPNSWSWSFPGGQPSTSDIRNPEVYYATPGTYSVTLTAANDIGSTTETFNGFIVVNGSLTSTVFVDDFDDGNADGWRIENIGGGSTWGLIDLPDEEGNTGDFAMQMVNFSNSEYGAIDALISPTMNLYSHTSATLEFEHAYRMNIQSESDILKVYVSNDGGETFPYLVYEASEDGSYNHATYVILNGEFTPQVDLDWCGEGPVGAECISIDISSYVSENFAFKIENNCRQGNNLYIDNIRVDASCSSASVNPDADFSAEDRMGCGSLTTQFFDESKGVPTSWSWNFPGGTPSSSTERNPEVTYSSVGSYDVELTVTNAQGTNTQLWEDYILISSSAPNADFTTQELVANAISFNNASSDAIMFEWDFGDGTFSNEENPFHNYGVTGNYVVILTATNGCGTDIYQQNITTTSTQDDFGPDASFDVYPNPNQGQFTIEVKGKNNQDAHLGIYDVLGRQVFSSYYQINSDVWTEGVNLNNLSTGTYILQINVNEATTFKKIVVR